MPGARCARSRVCRDSGVKHTRLSGHTGNRPAFPAQWFTAYIALSPVTGFLATVIGENDSANLMPASGHQDHTTSPSAKQSALVFGAACVHRIPPHVRDDRERPS
jgi:hypothetical protein